MGEPDAMSSRQDDGRVDQGAPASVGSVFVQLNHPWKFSEEGFAAFGAHATDAIWVAVATRCQVIGLARANGVVLGEEAANLDAIAFAVLA